ncbi:DUF1156 domain-containing protein [Thermogutta terrifontis]
MPVGVISQHARKDDKVRKGHLHTLHVWLATGPLATWRGALRLPQPA